ncbi:MAG: tetratricopeptide repeat protein [Deltaproteobacteria bacterium]|nr:tetratricopeptide repeat protein [Deltaproteobacteria bacterium]
MNRLYITVLVSTLLAAQTLSSTAAARGPNEDDPASARASEGMCVPPDTPQRVNECPSNAPKAQKTKGQTPQSRLRQAKRKVEQKKETGPKGPAIQIDVATLRNRATIQARAKKLLDQEVTITKRLIQNTRVNDSRRPDFLLRLAELYFEMITQQNAQVRKWDEPIYEACTKRKNAGDCRAARDRQKKEEAELNRIREANIKQLAILVRDHPDFRRMDEVLFSLGFSLEEMKQYDRARQVYHRLIKGYPQSKYIPNAYLSFAEYYFQQGDMQAAIRFYKKVTEIPPETNRVYGYALYKQAWCYYNLEDFRGSLQAFVETIEFGEKYPKSHNIDNLIKQSRREMIMPYAQVGNPERALEFFSRYAKTPEQAYEMLEHLAELYFDTGQWDGTIAVYHKLMAEKSEDDKICYWQTRVTNAIISSKPKPRQVVEIERMLDLWEVFEKSNRAIETRKACKQAAASVLIDLATAWHREAIGTDTQPGTNDRNTMELSAKLYNLILQKFPDMEKMEFPEIDKRDWPTEYKVSYYYAELLWKMEDWTKCGPAFDKVVELDPQGQYTADAAYAAVLCYNKSYQLTYQQDETSTRTDRESKKKKGKKEKEEEDLIAKFKSRDFTPLEQGMLNAFQRYVCFVPDSEDLAQIKYRRARIYYESNHFEEAAVLFKDIAFNHPQSDLAVYAANLYLDSLNVLGTYSEPKRPACFDDMNESIEPLFVIYCKTEEQKEAHGELCDVVEQLRCDLLRKKAETLQETEAYKKAASVYVTIFRKYQECGKLDEVLYNAAINFEAARLLGRAIKVRKVLIDRFKESEWAKRAIYLIGANFHALALYDQAAEYYEQFANRFPGEDGKNCSEKDKKAGTCAIAHEALQNATFFRLGLGNEEKAAQNAKDFEKYYKTRFPRESSQVKFSVGSIYERQKNWNKVIEHYKGFLASYRRSALPNEIIQANVAIGTAYLAMNDKNKASPFFRAAQKTWTAGAAEQIAKSGMDDEKKTRAIAEAKIATAEAIFFYSDELFDRFKVIKFPTYQPKTKLSDREKKLYTAAVVEKRKKMKEEFDKWMGSDFVKWMEAKAAALGEAEKSYGQIAQLEVPEWEIAAASRVGDMYRSFVDDFRDAPVPPMLEGDDELVDIYYQGLDEASTPWVEKAKGAYEYCLITATKVRWFNQYMTHCEDELYKLDPRQYPRAAELYSKQSYVYSANAAPGVVDLVMGEDEDLEGEE